MSVAPSKTYWIGGAPPYGFQQTPGYNALQVPAVGVGNETVLYERLDWTPGAGGDPGDPADQASYQNPPFIGVGSTVGGNRVPPWMDTGDPNSPKRILRGYMRRQTYTKLSTTTDPNLRASNARLYFMFNPTSIQRTYMSADALMSSINPTDDANGPPQAGIPIVSYTSVQFELFFDRQEEVNRFPDHPGVLVDLAVFDLLARGGSPGQSFADPNKAEEAKYTATGGGGIVTVSSDTGGSQVVNSTSLAFNATLPITAIFSPNIAFYGNIVAADAYFEKFSHRMTPTRMRLMMTMRINAIGPEKKATAIDAHAEAAAKNTAALRELDPNQPVDTDEKKDALNKEGRLSAMNWAEQWLPGKATTDGVPYNNEGKQCANAADDSYIDNGPPHIPTFMDCSAYVTRAYNTIGWSAALGWPTCGDTRQMWQGVKNKPDAWQFWSLGKFLGLGSFQAVLDYDSFNDTAQPGDILLHEQNHTAFVHDPGEGSGGDKNWNLLEEYGYKDKPAGIGNPPKIDHFTTSYIFGEYQYLLRAQPIKKGAAPDVRVLPTDPNNHSMPTITRTRLTNPRRR